jgi:hypothetical protein
LPRENFIINFKKGFSKCILCEIPKKIKLTE